jgi:hypothetical protein
MFDDLPDDDYGLEFPPPPDLSGVVPRVPLGDD